MIIDHVEEMAPIIYTPTVGEVCLQYSRLYRRARGMYFSSEDVGSMHAMVYNWPSDRVDVIVLTDGSRILGLGDLGVQGMGIPIGKLDLYVAGAGVHPGFVLPICLDVGTDNAALREDPCYLGIARPRLQGDEYYSVVHELVCAIRSRWPAALLQWEDFSTIHALDLLERYRYEMPTFNDDIQGTAAVVLAGVYGALKVQGLPPSAIAQQRFLVAGAGSAGMGIAGALFEAMVRCCSRPRRPHALTALWCPAEAARPGRGVCASKLLRAGCWRRHRSRSREGGPSRRPLHQCNRARRAAAGGCG